MEMGKRKREDEKTKTPMQMEREYRETLAAYNKLQREHQQYTTYYQQGLINLYSEFQIDSSFPDSM